MKKSTILLSALLLIAVSATIFVSCRKDLHEVALNNNNSIEKAEAQLVYEKIMKHDCKRRAFRIYWDQQI